MLKMVCGNTICETCGKEFEWRRCKTQKVARFCSKKCWYDNNAEKLSALNDMRFQWSKSSEEQKIEWLKARYEERVVKKEGCWGWNSTFDKDGYGQLNIASNKQGKAHRIAWRLYKGEIPHGFRVLHKCDNPQCSNPEHLFLGTPKDNSQDMAKKNRSTKGEKNSSSKLKDSQVVEIKRLLKMGVTQSRIANDFKITRQTIGCIKLGKTWKHIKD